MPFNWTLSDGYTLDEYLFLDSLLGRVMAREALSWLDTPYVNAGRERGLAVDCCGLILGLAHSLDLTQWDDRNYSPHEGAPKIRVGLDRFCSPVAAGAPYRPGDLALMRIAGAERHIGILSERLSLIHAYDKARRVVEVSYAGTLWERITVARYRWRLRTVSEGES
jgi:cell wall-associated NlpC family hydrolase